jgi:ATP-dependent Lhr-like helicase
LSRPSAFSRFPSRLQEAIASRLSWTSLRPVQEAASHAILDGKNAVVLAPTAGGKTEASIFPVLANLVQHEPLGLGAIYVAPIKALLNNQAERLGAYTEMVGLRRFLWHGDVTPAQKSRFLKEPATLLMTTPESLEVMLLSSKVPHQKLFEDLRFVIIDEVHAIAGSDRGAHLMSVLERINKFNKNDLQRIGLSATVGNPEAILDWLTGSSKREGVVVDPPKPPTAKDIRILYTPSVPETAQAAGKLGRGKKSLFFCQSRSLTEDVAAKLRGYDFDVFVHHSSVSLEERQAAESRFHSGGNAVIACTSTLELGIDVGDLDLVLQVDAPSTVSSFLQRMGRTGRREGTRANTTFFCQEPAIILQAIALVELVKSKWVENVRVNPRSWPVLVHQIMAMTLQFRAVSREAIWDQLHVVPDFRGIDRSEFDQVIDHLLAHDYLFQSEGLLSLGDHAERVYGRKNFMEMYAVFSSPQLYAVRTDAGREIGSLEQSFVDNLVSEMSTFLLGGRAWLAKHIDHSDRVIVVIDAPRGKKPQWGGYIPQFLGHRLCRKMAEILAGDEVPGYLMPAAKDCLATQRAEFGHVLRDSAWFFQVLEDDLLMWNFAGGAVNQTLKHGLELLLPSLTVSADNFKLKTKLGSETLPAVRGALAKLGDPRIWSDLEPGLLTCMPNYRLSKFQDALPNRASLEVVRDYLLDLPKAIKMAQLSGMPLQVGRTLHDGNGAGTGGD